MDLSWDIIARFGGEPALPRGFYDDFVAVAEEECKHHLLLKARAPPQGLEVVVGLRVWRPAAPLGAQRGGARRAACCRRLGAGRRERGPGAPPPRAAPGPGSVQGRRAACMQRLGCTSAAPASPAPELPSHCTTLSLRTSIKNLTGRRGWRRWGRTTARTRRTTRCGTARRPPRTRCPRAWPWSTACMRRAGAPPERPTLHGADRVACLPLKMQRIRVAQPPAARRGRAAAVRGRARARCAVPPHLLNGLIRCIAQNAARALALLATGGQARDARQVG